jgi:amino acid permease
MQIFSGLKDKLSEYIDTKLQLYQLNLEQKAVKLVATLIISGIQVVIFAICLLFFLLLLAKTINFFSESQFIGYGFVVLICIFMSMLLMSDKVQHRLNTRLKEIISKNFTKTEDGNEDSQTL